MQTVRYACERCGNCCRWPGDVRLTGADVTALAEHLKMPEPEFIAAHTRLNSTRTGLSLTERPDGACSFLKEDSQGKTACAVNPAKPAQCAGFPNTWRFPGWRQVCAAVPVQT